MPELDKKSLSEPDIYTKFITPALTAAKWDVMSQTREEVFFTKGRVIVRGKGSHSGEPKRTDYLHMANLDELARWCDALEARLIAAETTATHLFDATLQKIPTAPDVRELDL